MISWNTCVYVCNSMHMCVGTNKKIYVGIIWSHAAHLPDNSFPNVCFFLLSLAQLESYSEWGRAHTHTHAQTRARINIWWHVDSLAIDQFHPYAVDQAEIEYWVNGQQLTQRRLGMLIQRHFVYDGWRQIGKVLGLPINSNQEQSSITLRYHTRVHTKLYK